MKFSNMRGVILFAALIFAGSVLARAQNQWMDSILPPDHLLENLPWMDEEGKVQSKGLFDFENMRGISDKEGHEVKDLLLIYRQSAPVNELDKPHNQTLNVCFYNTDQKKYEKSFQDEGGTIQWIKLLKTPQKKAPFLVLQRDDLKGGQVLKGFVFADGAMKQVLDAAAPQAYVRFEGMEIWCSAKQFAKDRGDAEHILVWDAAKDKFIETKPAEGGMAGWSGSSIAVAETAVSKPATVASVLTAEKPKKPTHSSGKGWWDEPLDAAASMMKLRTELVPDLIKKNQVPVLGQKASAFFNELQKAGKTRQEVNGMRASYYAAVASTLFDLGHKKDAAYYLKTAFTFQKDNEDALAVKEKMN